MGLWTGEQRQKPTGHVGIQATVARAWQRSRNDLPNPLGDHTVTEVYLGVTPKTVSRRTSHLLVWESLPSFAAISVQINMGYEP